MAVQVQADARSARLAVECLRCRGSGRNRLGGRCGRCHGSGVQVLSTHRGVALVQLFVRVLATALALGAALAWLLVGAAAFAVVIFATGVIAGVW
ncbi:hypothetical protein [Conexibacter sp. S30A1]|uniref:hypothetical protein n=1 Tax=Conexibacter sp. S30A1 TaxID=2937800 RepID=UPI0020106566|nr:hypothetical protein [Conexibacter sp. S30A1]